MKIEEGKYYRTRGGNVFGPMARTSLKETNYVWRMGGDTSPYSWTDEGYWRRPGYSDQFDLIAEVYVSDTPPPDTGESDACKAEAELREMMRDPRYWRTREPEFVKRVMEGFLALVGGDMPPADVENTFQNCTIGTYAPETKTLRDEFAMAALKAMLGHSDYVELSPDQMAVEAYRQANAMMEARKK